MHTALVSCDGEKMSKSLGNLVFIDQLRAEWDPMVIRLVILEHHYRDEWGWDAARLDANAERLLAWRRSATNRHGDEIMSQVRQCLDNDLDTVGAVKAIDAAASEVDVAPAAHLLGVRLD